MAQFWGTKIYQANGVEVTAEEINNSYFQNSEALAASLTSAVAAGGVVEQGWQTTSEFEEWTDRLILRRTTTYTLIDGNAFEANHVTAVPFVPSQGLVEDPAVAPDMLQLATDFIAADGHLALYPEALAAGNIGPQALLDELGNNRGPVTYTEELVFSRMVEKPGGVLDDPQPVGHLEDEPMVGDPLDPGFLALEPFEIRKVNQFDPVVPDPPVDPTGGISCYRQDMMNGYFSALEYFHKQKWGNAATFVELDFFAHYGFAVRIPWQAKVTVEPKLISELQPDLTPFTCSLSIHTLDADAAYLTGQGVVDEHLYGAKELVAFAGVGLAAKVKVLGATVLDRPRSNPLVGLVIDLGRHFDPPMNGNSVDLTGAVLPFEATGFGYTGWLLGAGADLQLGAGIQGNGFDLNVGPHNAWNSLTGGGISKSIRTIFVAEEDNPESLPFVVDDDSPKMMDFGGDHYYRHGAVYSDAVYDTDITLSPGMRLRGKLNLSSISPFLSDKNISTPWLTLFTMAVTGPDFSGPHDSVIEAYHLNRRELGKAPDGTVMHDFAHDGAGTWTISLNPDCEADVGQIIEILDPDNPVVPVNIVGGGVYDPATHTIVWDFTGGAPPVISYQLAGPITSRPEPLAKWTPVGLTEEETVLPAGGNNLTATENALLLRDWGQRPTWQEVIDGRPGSSLLEVDSQNEVRLFFQLDTSEDLQTWTTVPETVANPLEVVYALPAGKRFFRWREE